MLTKKSPNKRYLWFAAAGVVLAVSVGYFSMYWPPVEHRNVQGAIGQRKVYREAQLTDADVGVAGQAKVTVDDLKKLIASREFREAAGNPGFQRLLSSAAFNDAAKLPGATGVLFNQNLQSLIQNHAYGIVMANPNFQQLIGSQQFQLLMAGDTKANSAQIQNLANQHGLAGNMAVIQLIQSAQFQSLFMASNQQLGALIASQQFMHCLNSPELHGVLQNSAAMRLMHMPASYALFSSPQVQALAAQGQLVNLVNNSALQGAVFGLN